MLGLFTLETAEQEIELKVVQRWKELWWFIEGVIEDSTPNCESNTIHLNQESIHV